MLNNSLIIPVGNVTFNGEKGVDCSIQRDLPCRQSALIVDLDPVPEHGNKDDIKL